MNQRLEAADGRRWQDRFAVGGYAGLGVGLHIHWFALYGRLRIQGSKADGAPETMWNSGVVGMQFRVVKRVDLYAAGGFASYMNDDDALSLGIYELGLAVHFSLTKLRARRQSKRAAGAR